MYTHTHICIYVYHVFFIHSSADRHLGCFQEILFLNGFYKRPRLVSHWLGLGYILIPGPMNGTKGMEYADWPGLIICPILEPGEWGGQFS